MAGLIKGFGLLADAGGYISSKAKDLIDEISEFADVDSNGMVSVFHRTSKENADKIRESGIFTPKEDGIFFSTKRGGANSDGYGDEVIELKIPADKLELDDIFDGEAHLRLPAKANKPNDVSEFIPNKPLPEPSGLLDMSTPARMSRADDMGFDTDTTYYHGTDEDFDAFDPQSVGSNFGFDKKGFFFTTSKDSANRSRKSYPSGSKYTYTDEQKKAAAGGRVIGTHLKLNNPLTRKDIEGFDSGGGGQSPIALYDLNRAKIEKALESGQYDGVKIKAEGQTMVTVLEPSQIRSTDATFDPAKASSSNLLASNPAAGATAAGMGLIAMGASDDSEAGVVGKLTNSLFGMLDAGKKSGEVVNYPDEWISQVPYELRKEVARHNEGILGSSYREGMEASPTYYHGTSNADIGSFNTNRVFVSKSNKVAENEGGFLDSSFNDIIGRDAVDKSNAKFGTSVYPLKLQGEIADSRRVKEAINSIGAGSANDARVVDGLKGEGFQGMAPSGYETVSFSPSNIRSTNAVFDPAKASSSNLLASKPAATMGAGLLSNITGQPSNLESYMQGNTDVYLTAEERAYVNNKQEFENMFADDAGYRRADFWPMRVNQQTGERDWGYTPQIVKGILGSLNDLGQMPKTGISNQQSILDLF